MSMYLKSPETVIIFNSYKREDISIKSLNSLLEAIKHQKDRVKIIVSDATPNIEKIEKIKSMGIEDILWTPGFTSAATSRNLAVEYLRDKYVPEFICFVEDDLGYSMDWYNFIVEATRNNYGKKSPFGLAYGMFTAMSKRLPSERTKMDMENNLLAYIFGAVADQRFMPFNHYVSVLRMWDPDILGVSYCQTGMQTSRNTMRGYCGGVLTKDNLCWTLEETISTWDSQRDPGPNAHEFDVNKFEIVCETAKKFYK